jgi:hypothetical protein
MSKNAARASKPMSKWEKSHTARLSGKVDRYAAAA